MSDESKPAYQPDYEEFRRNRSGIIYWLTSRTCWLLFSLFFSLRVYGRENIPKKGPFIIAANHCSHLDPPLMGGVFQRSLSFMAKAELFTHGFLHWYISRLGAFPIRRGAPDRRAIRLAGDILKAGGALVIFPEGTRSRDGKLQEPQTGVAMILKQSPETPVLPVYIDGTYQVWGSGSKKIRLFPIRVSIDKPFSIDQTIKENKVKKQLYREISAQIMREIAQAKSKLP